MNRTMVKLYFRCIKERGKATIKFLNGLLARKRIKIRSTSKLKPTSKDSNVGCPIRHTSRKRNKIKSKPSTNEASKIIFTILTLN